MEERFNAITLIVGFRGTGKTTFARSFFENYSKVLVLDTNDHPAYRDLAEIEPRQLRRWKKGHKRLFRGDPKQNLAAIENDVSNALIVFEDARKYIKRTLPEELERMITDSKQRNNDIFLLYHSLSMIPPFLFQSIDYLTLFFTKESLGSSLRSKLPFFDLVAAAHQKVARIAGQGRKENTLDRFYHLTIDFSA